jgi:N-acetylmuramoyl-L-alanine amidase
VRSSSLATGALLLVIVTGCTATAGTTQRGAAVRQTVASHPPAGAPAGHHHRTPLKGKTIGIDPGHNGKNYAHPHYINHQIWNGREWENCNTTGTSTNGGYPEPRFTWHVAKDLRRDLRREGAHVVMTRHNNHGVGPCVNRRARIINQSHAVVGIDIHGDGGPSSGRGFAILEPVRDRYNKHVIHSSARFGHVLHRQVLRGTAMPTSTYDGHNGYTHRNDLAGLNLTKVPLVLIECGNMRNATDARLMTSKKFQHRLAHGFARAITKFARHRGSR